MDDLEQFASAVDELKQALKDVFVPPVVRLLDWIADKLDTLSCRLKWWRG